LLTKSLAYLNTTQRAALRSTTTVALHNAQALRDLINYCDTNVYNGDCNSYIAAQCLVGGASRSCITQYSTKLFDLANLNELQLMQQQYSHLVNPAAIADMGMALLQIPDSGVISYTFGVPAYDTNSAKVTSDYGFWVHSTREAKSSGDFMFKTDKKMTVGKVNFNYSQGSDTRYKVSVYANGEWQVSQDSSSTVDQSVIDAADYVDGYYHYRVEH
jgi:hypothetical protein